MSSSTNPKGANPPASASQDDGISDTTPHVPSGIYTQHQQQLMTMPSMNTPILPSSSTNEAQGNPFSNKPIDPADLRLPLSNILRIMRAALPEHKMIEKSAKEAMEQCAVEFIQFLTSEAAESASRANRKTLHGDDVLRAMKNTGFDHYAEALRPYLENYRMRQRRGSIIDLGLEEEDEETVAAGKRRRAPTPELPPSSP